MKRTGILIGLVVLAACRGRDAAAAHASPSVTTDSAPLVPGYVVDSALPIDETLRRFRVGLAPVTRLDSGAARSRQVLFGRFGEALMRRDTAALHAMALTPAEFAYLYFPNTQYVRPPYEMPPDVLWNLMHARSESGLKRAVARLGNPDLRISSVECEPGTTTEGSNQLLLRCMVRFRRTASDRIERKRLFGSVIERDGRYKFVSYANDF